jgi:hypothetical protein
MNVITSRLPVAAHPRRMASPARRNEPARGWGSAASFGVGSWKQPATFGEGGAILKRAPPSNPSPKPLLPLRGARAWHPVENENA